MNLFTARVRSTREGYVLTRVCVSVHTCRGRGTPSQVCGWGYPIPGLAGGGNPSQVWMVGRYYPIPGWAGGTCPRLGRGTPSQVWVGGYPIPGLDGGGYPGYPPPGQVWMVVGYPWPGLDGGVGTWGTPPPIRQSSLANTCYSAGGLPLAFTQEDFLVSTNEEVKGNHYFMWTIYLQKFERFTTLKQ